MEAHLNEPIVSREGPQSIDLVEQPRTEITNQINQKSWISIHLYSTYILYYQVLLSTTTNNILTLP